MQRHPALQMMLDNMFGAVDGNTCRTCKRPVSFFRDRLSAQEFGISQMCQNCQDGVFCDVEEVCEQLGLDIEAPPPNEEQLLALLERPDNSVAAQRWIVAMLYNRAFKRQD